MKLVESTTSLSTIWTRETKSDIIKFAIGNPANKTKVKLTKTNRNILGSDTADLFTKRHNYELQRCSQFYSLASLFNETSTKDKHPAKRRNLKKMYFSAQKYLLRLFVCF